MQKKLEYRFIDYVEYEASFPGGRSSMKNFLSKRFVIPDSLENSGKKIYGTIIASFSVEKDGSFSEFEIIKGVNPILDDEWLRVLMLMPKWKPAMQQGRIAKTRLQLSVTIDIAED